MVPFQHSLANTGKQTWTRSRLYWIKSVVWTSLQKDRNRRTARTAKGLNEVRWDHLGMDLAHGYRPREDIPNKAIQNSVGDLVLTRATDHRRTIERTGLDLLTGR